MTIPSTRADQVLNIQLSSSAKPSLVFRLSSRHSSYVPAYAMQCMMIIVNSARRCTSQIPYYMLSSTLYHIRLYETAFSICSLGFSFPKLTAKSYIPKNTAPPVAIAVVLGTQPANRAANPSFLKICARRGPKDKTDGDG